MKKSYDKKTEPFTLPVIRTLYDLGKIELKPDYQRESVWTKSQKQLLIDSLIREYDVPKLYFRKIDKGKIEYEVVDGQQRIQTVLDFYCNELRLSDDADPLDKIGIAGRLHKELPTEAVMALDMARFDVVVLSNYSDDQVRELFSRLQNGTSLNAAEKRHAFSGAMTAVVNDLASNTVFPSVCDFSSSRYAFEDLAAKVLHQILAGRIVDIRPSSIKTTYNSHRSITKTHAAVKRTERAFNLLKTSLSGRTVKLRKYALLSLAILVDDLLNQYNLRQFAKDFGNWYESFEIARVKNRETDETDSSFDSELAEFTDNARNDSVAALTYRDAVLRRRAMAALPDMELLDPTRQFSDEQRFVIYVKGGGKCSDCEKEISIEEMHADHVTAYAKGGKTAVSNGRSLCRDCNLTKSSR